MVAAARTVRVEVARRHALLDQIPACRAVGLDRARRRDVVGRHAVAEQSEHARAGDIGQRRRGHRHAFEERRATDVGRVGIPVEAAALRHVQHPPALIAFEHPGVRAPEHVRVHRAQHRVLDLLLGWPDVLEVDRIAREVLAKRLRGEILRDPTGKRVGHHERRRRKVVRPHVLLNAPLEIAIPAQHRADDEVLLADDG